MKKLVLILAVLLALSFVSCSDNAPDAPDTPEVTTDSLDTIVQKIELPQDEKDNLFELFELNAAQLREKHGEMTTEFYAYGGTPVCSLKNYAGVFASFLTEASTLR